MASRLAFATEFKKRKPLSPTTYCFGLQVAIQYYYDFAPAPHNHPLHADEPDNPCVAEVPPISADICPNLASSFR